jgi:transcriptional regulator of acetoin/glycerol metabolism
MQDATAHISRLTSVVENPVRFREFEEPERTIWRPSIASWRRCFEQHRLDPSAKRRDNILSTPELSRHIDMMGKELRLTGEELDNLFLAVRGSGYSVSLGDRNGLVVLERSDYHVKTYVPADRPGSIWSEQVGGTNGVGTAIIEQRPVAVYHGDHFFPELINVACIGSPIFDADNQMLGVFNLSIRNPQLPEQTHRLIFDVANAAARRLEQRLFQERFRHASVIRLAVEDGPAPLLAVGPDHEILGLNRPALQFLGLAAVNKAARLWDYFERKSQLINASADHADIVLRRLGSGRAVHARTTGGPPPASAPARRPGPARAVDEDLPRALAECAGGDAAMLRQMRLVQRVRGSNLPILLLGETGVGKDTLARAIHNAGERAQKPFIAFNCAAIQETLIDSELFGYGAGAFTGARKEGSAGRIAQAHGGTLFLDEIGDMPLGLQTRLLRVLESGEIAPLGNGRVQHVDIRIIAATNQELDARVAEGRFRRDLYYRLAGLVLTLPPLRERSDLEMLAERILAAVSGGELRVSTAARARLRAHDWPGNIRELRHVLHRAAQFAEHGVVEAQDLMLPDAGRRFAAGGGVPAPERETSGIIERAERDAIEATMTALRGDINLCARQLGISRATLYRKLRAYGIRTGRR